MRCGIFALMLQIKSLSCEAALRFVNSIVIELQHSSISFPRSFFPICIKFTTLNLNHLVEFFKKLQKKFILLTWL